MPLGPLERASLSHSSEFFPSHILCLLGSASLNPSEFLHSLVLIETASLSRSVEFSHWTN
jgi:hypothetical protein